MFERESTRRGALQTIGTAVSAATIPVAGCLGGDDQSNTDAENPTSTPTATPIQPPRLEPRLYTNFAPHPERIDRREDYQLTASRPAVAAANQDAFGESLDSVFSTWSHVPLGTAIEEMRLNVLIDRIVGAADLMGDDGIG